MENIELIQKISDIVEVFAIVWLTVGFISSIYGIANYSAYKRLHVRDIKFIFSYWLGWVLIGPLVLLAGLISKIFKSI